MNPAQRTTVVVTAACVLMGAVLGGCSGQPAPTVVVTLTVSPSPTQPGGSGPTPSGSWEEVAARARGAVVRIATTNCEPALSGVVGSGFAIGDHLLVTAAHVVEHQSSFQVESDDLSTQAVVLGYDQQADVALLRINPTSTSVLAFATLPPRQAEQVVLLGFPEGVSDLRVTSGTVTSLDGTGSVEADGEVIERDHLLVTDAAMNPGNSGGPVINAGGQVVGVASSKALHYQADQGIVVPAEGNGYAVQPDRFTDLLDGWSSRTAAVNTCVLTNSSHVVVNADEFAGDQAAVVAAIDTFWMAINNGDLDTAWTLLSDRGRAVKGSLTRWQGRVNGLQYSDAVVAAASVDQARATLTAGVDLTESTATGVKCKTWRMTYQLENDGGYWLVGPATGRVTGTC